jgi:LysR family transcriptional regulator, nitrogen assimilation regulatory protein
VIKTLLDFETLKLFLAVSEHGSFTRAAIKLGMTQPTISKRVGQLEDEMGSQLLYRHGRGVSLTDSGQRLIEVARSVIVQLETIKAEFDDSEHHLRGWVTLGLPPSLGASLSVPLARAFQDRFPQAKLRIIEAFSGSLLELIEAGKVDLGVLYDARLSPTLLVSPLLREDLYLIESGSIRGVDGPADLGELAIGPFVLSGSSNGLRRVVDSAAAMAGLQMNISFEIDSLTALKRLVEIGPERCVLPYGAVHREVREGTLNARPFSSRDMSALLVSAMPLHRAVPRLIKELRDLLVEQVEESIRAGMISGTTL